MKTEHVIEVDLLDELEGDADFDFDAAWQAVEPDDLLTLIYTSGTTGDPKGVQLTHKSMLFTMRAYDAVLHFPRGGNVVSYLPMAHIAERNCSHYFPMQFGFTRHLLPRRARGRQLLPRGPPVVVLRRAADLREAQGRDRVRARRSRIRPPCASSSGWTGWPRSTSAPPRCPPEVIEFFHSIGLPLGELWGMSETNAIGACNPPESIKIGTVGPAVPGRRAAARRRRRGRAARRLRVRRLPRPGGEDARDVHRRRLAARRATSASSTRTATSRSSTARRS